MVREIIAVTYFTMIPVSWLIISGWLYAEQRAYSRWLGTLGGGPTPSGSSAKDSGFATLLAAFVSLVWPLALPAVFCDTGYAAHGWEPVWRLDD